MKILEGKKGKQRTAYMKAVIAYTTSGKEIKLFSGVCKGRIAEKERGRQSDSLAFDKIFIPSGYSKTFAEMKRIKQKMSHRKRALERFKAFLLKTKEKKK